MNYLIENKECERSFLRRLWSFWSSLDPILIKLGFNPHCSWALIEVEMSDLGASLKGDVDILIGHTTWNDPKQFDAALNEHMEMLSSAAANALIQLVNPANMAADMVAWNGGIQWPPPTNYLAGIEVKCSRLAINVDPYKASIAEDDMKSTKSSWQKTEKIRLETNKLLHLGLDKVALLDLIANPPADGVNIGAWSNASMIASKTEKAMSKIFSNRLLLGSVAGHWVYSLGAVAGGNEALRGAGYPNQYRTPQQNIFATETDTYNRRQALEKSIISIFNRLPNPYSLPALYINCRNCRVIHRCAMGDPCSDKNGN
jgi:hypothetical protein